MDKTIYKFKSQIFSDTLCDPRYQDQRFVIERSHPRYPDLVWLLCVSDYTLSMTDYVSRDCIEPAGIS